LIFRVRVFFLAVLALLGGLAPIYLASQQVRNQAEDNCDKRLTIVAEMLVRNLGERWRRNLDVESLALDSELRRLLESYVKAEEKKAGSGLEKAHAAAIKFFESQLKDQLRPAAELILVSASGTVIAKLPDKDFFGARIENLQLPEPLPAEETAPPPTVAPPLETTPPAVDTNTAQALEQQPEIKEPKALEHKIEPKKLAAFQGAYGEKMSTAFLAAPVQGDQLFGWLVLGLEQKDEFAGDLKQALGIDIAVFGEKGIQASTLPRDAVGMLFAGLPPEGRLFSFGDRTSGIVGLLINASKWRGLIHLDASTGSYYLLAVQMGDVGAYAMNFIALQLGIAIVVALLIFAVGLVTVGTFIKQVKQSCQALNKVLDGHFDIEAPDEEIPQPFLDLANATFRVGQRLQSDAGAYALRQRTGEQAGEQHAADLSKVLGGGGPEEAVETAVNQPSVGSLMPEILPEQPREDPLGLFSADAGAGKSGPKSLPTTESTTIAVMDHPEPAFPKPAFSPSGSRSFKPAAPLREARPPSAGGLNINKLINEVDTSPAPPRTKQQPPPLRGAVGDPSVPGQAESGDFLFGMPRETSNPRMKASTALRVDPFAEQSTTIAEVPEDWLSSQVKKVSSASPPPLPGRPSPPPLRPAGHQHPFDLSDHLEAEPAQSDSAPDFFAEKTTIASLDQVEGYSGGQSTRELDPNQMAKAAIKTQHEETTDPAARDWERGSTIVGSVSADVIAGLVESTKKGVDEDPFTSHAREVYASFLSIRQRCSEPIAGLSFDKFLVKVSKNREALIARHGCRDVRFEAYEKDRKAALKATPVK
jgi:hypothetical protein